MKLTDIEKAIKGHLNANFSTTPVAWPNRHFAPQKDAPDGRWVRPTIRMGETLLKELGADGTGERYGMLFLDIFTRKNTGSALGSGIADELEELFRREALNDELIFDEGTTSDMGTDAVNTELNRHQVKVPFFAFTG